MARCSGLVCTVGFESVSEAMYLGQLMLGVPVEEHFEQRCEGRVDRLLRHLPHHATDLRSFRQRGMQRRSGTCRCWERPQGAGPGARPPSRSRTSTCEC